MTSDNPSGQVVLRRATASDIDAVLSLWRVAAEEPTATDDVPALRALLERDDQALLLAVRDGAVVGSVIAGWDGWRGNLYRLAVVPDQRRQGIARRLVGAAEERLRAQGARRVHAGVLGAYDPATSFWVAAGYAFDDRIRRHRKNLPRG